MTAANVPCPACHGTGQWTFFGGVSRFFLTIEECPECGGLGVIAPPAPQPVPDGEQKTADAAARRRQKHRGRKPGNKP